MKFQVARGLFWLCLVVTSLWGINEFAQFAQQQETLASTATTPSRAYAQYQCAQSVLRESADEAIANSKEMIAQAKERAKLATFPSVEQIISERRLSERRREQFCLKLAACFADANDPSQATFYAARVESCLSEDDEKGE